MHLDSFHSLRPAILLGALALLAGCESDAKRKKPEDDQMGEKSSQEELGIEEFLANADAHSFEKLWVDPEFDLDRYTEVHVPAVMSEHCIEASFWEDCSYQGNLQEDAKRVGEYLRQKVTNAFRQDPKKRFRVVDQPGEKTLVLELAILEIVPTKAWFNTVSANVGHLPAFGTVRIEGRASDGASGKGGAMFIDKEENRMEVFYESELAWYSHAQVVIDRFAEKLVTISNLPKEVRHANRQNLVMHPW